MDAKPAVFLDRDGTIIEDRGHLGRIEDVEFFPFAFEALRLLQKDHLLFIVTNQSSISLGLVSAESVARVNEFVLSTLSREGIAIAELYCCGHRRDDNCECIKPKPFFISKACEKYQLDIPNSYTIGDHPHDVTFGTNAGALGLYLLTGHGAKHRADVAPGTRVFKDLLEAAHWIAHPSRHVGTTPPHGSQVERRSVR